MTRKLMIVLALLIAVSCVPVQAAESKSAWTIVKNSAKILVGAWLAVGGIRNIAVGCGGEDGVRAVYRRFNLPINERQIGILPTVHVVMGAGLTVGGVALVYSGVKGLTEEEESAKA